MSAIFEGKPNWSNASVWNSSCRDVVRVYQAVTANRQQSQSTRSSYEGKQIGLNDAVVRRLLMRWELRGANDACLYQDSADVLDERATRESSHVYMVHPVVISDGYANLQAEDVSVAKNDASNLPGSVLPCSTLPSKLLPDVCQEESYDGRNNDNDKAADGCTALWEDPDIAEVIHPSDNSANNNQQGCYRRSTLDGSCIVCKDASEWRISIVYNHVWSCPVLYFTVQSYLDGTPWTRQQVIAHLRHLSGSNNPQNDLQEQQQQQSQQSQPELYSLLQDGSTWEWVSMEEHPVTGTPAYFLHPCRTPERLKILMQSTICMSTQHTGPLMLLAWMALILPSIGYSVDPTTYQVMWSMLQTASSAHNSERNTAGAEDCTEANKRINAD
jgi:Autophagocytosis associated protein, active-site domain